MKRKNEKRISISRAEKQWLTEGLEVKKLRKLAVAQYFLITVTDCCAPELTGPFNSKRERDEQGAAIEPTLEDNDKNYLLKLDIEFGKVSVSLIPIE